MLCSYCLGHSGQGFIYWAFGNSGNSSHPRLPPPSLGTSRLWGTLRGETVTELQRTRGCLSFVPNPGHAPLPALPGPSPEVPDELLLLSPLAHPEPVGDDVAGLDPALGAGPAKRENSRSSQLAPKPTPLWGAQPPPRWPLRDTDLVTSRGKSRRRFRQVRRQPGQWACVQLGRMPKIRLASGLSHTLSMQMPHTTSRLSCSLCSRERVREHPPTHGHCHPKHGPAGVGILGAQHGRTSLTLTRLPHDLLYLQVHALK